MIVGKLLGEAAADQSDAHRLRCPYVRSMQGSGGGLDTRSDIDLTGAQWLQPEVPPPRLGALEGLANFPRNPIEPTDHVAIVERLLLADAQTAWAQIPARSHARHPGRS